MRPMAHHARNVMKSGLRGAKISRLKTQSLHHKHGVMACCQDADQGKEEPPPQLLQVVHEPHFLAPLLCLRPVMAV